jgi:hypothetical protein
MKLMTETNMQIKAINPLGCEFYVHVSPIKSEMLRQHFGSDYTINFWERPQQGADPELVSKAAVDLLTDSLWKDWDIRVV